MKKTHHNNSNQTDQLRSVVFLSKFDETHTRTDTERRQCIVRDKHVQFIARK